MRGCQNIRHNKAIEQVAAEMKMKLEVQNQHILMLPADDIFAD
jgi:hypothetical protein